MVYDLPVIFPGYSVEFHGVGIVNGAEQGWEGIAEIEATTAAVADVENATELIKQGFFLVELTRTPVERMARGRLKTALASAQRTQSSRVSSAF